MQRECDEKCLWTVPAAYSNEEGDFIPHNEQDQTAQIKEKMKNERWLCWFDLIDR